MEFWSSVTLGIKVEPARAREIEIHGAANSVIGIVSALFTIVETRKSLRCKNVVPLFSDACLEVSETRCNCAHLRRPLLFIK